MVLLVCSLVELVRTLIGASILLSCALLGLTPSIFRDNVKRPVPTLRCSFFSLDFHSELLNLFTILRKVDSVESFELRQPNLELCSETLVLRSHAAEHGVYRILDQVKVLEYRVLYRKYKNEHRIALVLTHWLMCVRTSSMSRILL